jgi:D-beta-D-heptose 7-phosphate kinase/D-beta-D-heptose 1-phosphate adenosyltransferase
MGTVINRDELSAEIERLRKAGKRIVTTNGCFDLLHVGHTRFLKAAKQLGDVLAVGLNSDDSVRKLKGAERPINNENDRAEILASLGCVDFVSIFAEDTPVEFIKAVRPHVHAKGADYKPSDLAETPVVESMGGEVHIIELVPGRSTTAIVKKLSQKD